MKAFIRLILPIIIASLVSSCGPSKSQLKAELQGVEREMIVLQAAANRHRSEMRKADFDAFISGFATGFGIVADSGDLTTVGARGIEDASNRSDVAAYSLNQIQQRYNVLAKRREEIIRALQ